MSQSRKSVPKRRFMEFNNAVAWEQRKLGKEVENVATGRSTFFTSIEQSSETPYAVLGSTSVISYDKNFDHSGDFILTARVGANAGNLYKYSGDVKISDNTVYIQAKSLDFVYYLLNKFDLKRLSFGTGQPLVKASELKNLKLMFPNDEEEQQKIGKFFKYLDDTIALHQRKLEKIKALKTAYLSEMFPAEEETKPKRRFAGYTDDWKQRKLGEDVNFLNGRAYSQRELLDKGKYKVLRVGNFNTNDRWYYSDLELEENKYANSGDLLYLWATNFGPEIWNQEKVIYHYHIWKLKIMNTNVSKQYLYTWLITDKERIKQSTNGTTMVHVTKGHIEQREFQIPSNLTEQQKIGSFFKQLDKTIALHQRKLQKLQNIKKAYLNEMFI
ncbi:restriction endonuclease subunit S [Listeria monocytogenes]|nr:restriction endonuclease subunit S [Listeria monocytogenes]